MPQAERGRVLVTDAWRGSAIAVMRSLGRAGYHVVAADSDRDSIGFRSRYAHQSVVYPSPRRDPELFCDAIERIVATESIDLVIPVTDLALQPLATQRQRFAPFAQLAIAPDAALAVTTDKSRTLALAKELGIPTPPTRVVHTLGQALDAANEWGWPLVLKPDVSHKVHSRGGIESFEVTYAESPRDLRDKLQGLEGRCRILLQRYCRGAGHGIELLMSEGRALAAFQHARRHEIPLSGGASSYRESVALDTELYEHSVRILSALGWTGLAMVEFKVEPGRAELMEINGRIWGSLPLAVASGMDFPSLLARLYLRGEESVEPRLDNAYRIGVRCRDLQKDLLWIAEVLAQQRRFRFHPMPSRYRALRALLGILNPWRRQDLLAWDDPAPALYQLPQLLPHLWNKSRKWRERRSPSKLDSIRYRRDNRYDNVRQ
jgi:predicted ATP-grasp superfamily ATP-dependent carboligase